MVDVFKNKVPNFAKLLNFGFRQEGDCYVYHKAINNEQFTLQVVIGKDEELSVKIIDNDFGEEYVLHLVAEATGEYVGKIRTEYNDILQKIADECFEWKFFKSTQAQEIMQYVKQKYGDELEYLWPKFPNNAIWRRKDNKKWYGAILTTTKDKIGLIGKETIEVLDLRADKDMLPQIVDNKKYFAGYHMNKQHWISIVLDGELELAEICQRLDDSYKLAKN